jgi:hypothetical protein
MALFPLLRWLEMMENKGGGENAIKELDGVDALDDLALGFGFEGDDQLAGVLAAVNVGSLNAADALDNPLNPVGARVNHKAGDVALAHEIVSAGARRMASAGQAWMQSPQPLH